MIFLFKVFKMMSSYSLQLQNIFSLVAVVPTLGIIFYKLIYII